MSHEGSTATANHDGYGMRTHCEPLYDFEKQGRSTNTSDEQGIFDNDGFLGISGAGIFFLLLVCL